MLGRPRPLSLARTTSLRSSSDTSRTSTDTSPSSRTNGDTSIRSSRQSQTHTGGEWQRFYVLCMYDYEATDPDHLTFRRNEIFEIVRTEASGWWAALTGDKIRWLPNAFVERISDEMAESLRALPEEQRINAFNAETLYGESSSPLIQLYQSSSPSEERDWGVVPVGMASPGGLVTARELPTDVTPGYSTLNITIPSRPSFDNPPAYSSPDTSPEYTPPSHREIPRSPTSALPVPPLSSGIRTAPLMVNKPTPPTPTSAEHAARSRSGSDTTGTSTIPNPAVRDRSSVRRPLYIEEKSLLNRLSVLIENGVDSNESVLDLNLDPKARNPKRTSIHLRRGEKVRQLTGDEDAQAFHNAKVAQAGLPWYLKPDHGPSEIKLEYDGSVKAGTLEALVERLTVDPLKLNQEKMYRKAFLTVYKSFATTDEVFDLLTDRYVMDHPPGLTDEQFLEWKEKKLRPTQARILTVLGCWMEQHGLLVDDPQIAPRLRSFLADIKTPSTLALTAKHLLQSLDKLSGNNAESPTVSVVTPTSKRRKPKPFKNELLKIDPQEMASQLTHLESRLYCKIRPVECLHWAKLQKGDSVRNLLAFCLTSDRLATWVKFSVLSNEGLGKRADTVDMWIKVAEKCRQMNNISSMSAIVAALSSTVIARLHLTWAHVGRRSNLESLAQLTDPTGNFSAYRNLFTSLDGSCVPFIGIYLTDLVHINDQHKDITLYEGIQLINFIKREKMGDIVHAMLKHQAKPYSTILENAPLLGFIESQLSAGATKDEGYFWLRSQELSAAEVAHADIRKGLEAAGF